MATVEIPTTEQPARKKMFGLPIDTMLLVVAGGLVAFGLMMVYSTTFDWSYREFGSPSVIFMRQVRWLGVGLVAMLVAARMPYHWWRRLSVVGMAATLIALVGVLVSAPPPSTPSAPSSTARCSRPRWLSWWSSCTWPSGSTQRATGSTS